MDVMNRIAIVDNNSLVIVSSYPDSAPHQEYFGGNWGNPNVTSHILCPDSVSGNTSLLSVSGSFGGLSGIYLVINDGAVFSWKQQQNKVALDAYTASRSAQADTDIHNTLISAFGQSADDTTYLMM